MKEAQILLLLRPVLANIVFHRVQPQCNASNIHNTGCLRGQVCLSSGNCVHEFSLGFPLDPISFIRNALPSIESKLPRQDGRCGSAYGGALCDSTGAFGGCCSKYGWCGVTTAHCSVGQGCQSGCAPDSVSLPMQATGNISLTISSGEPAAIASQEPVLGLPTGPSSTSATSLVTTDGSCGANFGGAVCGDWPRGSCCSMYGYCGNTTAHCDAGCQSGGCLLNGAVQAPSPKPAPANPVPGSFQVISDSGIPAMHAALLPNGRVAFLDKVENYTKLRLFDNEYAFASEWNPATGKSTALSVKTNPFCSAGSFLADGTLVNVGGNGPLLELDPTVGDGFAALRYLKRSFSDSSFDDEDWIENKTALSSGRWYASTQTLSDGRIFVASGSLNGLDPTIATNNNPTYEFLSRTGSSSGPSVSLDILVRTQPYYMYPFIHLLNTGDLFIFVSKSSELWSPSKLSSILVYPDLAGDYRTYPNTGTSVLLPLSSENQWDSEVIVCGGGAYQDMTSPTDPSCGRIAPLSQAPKWEMDAMPQGRGMVEGVLLPDGSIVFLNGCNRGAQGFLLASNPTVQALLYRPSEPLGKRWTTLANSTIPRLYHSVALLMLDGTIAVAGSNPNEQPVLKSNANAPLPTEFRIEQYTPPYLSGPNAKLRPTNVKLSSTTLKANASNFTLTVTVPAKGKKFQVSLYHGGFVTHSLHMGQRLAFLDNSGWKAGQANQKISVQMPPNNNVAPPGPYQMFVLADGVPSVGVMVMVS